MSIRDKLRAETEATGSTNAGLLARVRKASATPSVSIAKIIKGGPGASAAISVTPEMIDISAPSSIGDEPVGISVIAEAGTVVRGPLGLIGSPSDFKIGGLFSMNDLLMIGPPPIPGAPPIPVLVPSMPFGILRSFAETISMLSRVGGA